MEEAAVGHDSTSAKNDFDPLHCRSFFPYLLMMLTHPAVSFLRFAL